MFLLTAAGCAAIISSLNSQFDGFAGSSRTHLRPIPVSRKVCPYVRAMHAAANNFQRVNPIDRLLADPGSSPRAWPAEQARIRQSLDVLEFSVVASRPHFPPRIRERLGVVVTSIRNGRPEVDRAHGEIDLATRTAEIFYKGEYAFGDASDLVGDACGVHLAADPR